MAKAKKSRSFAMLLWGMCFSIFTFGCSVFSLLLMGCGQLSTTSSDAQMNIQTPLAKKEFATLKSTILVPKCVMCHGASASTPLTTYAEVMHFVRAGNAATSVFYQQLDSGDMPSGGARLSDGELQLVSSWINEGAREFEVPPEEEPVNQKPSVTLASSLVTVQLPTSTASLSATISDPDGTISSIVWVQTSGAALTITTPTMAATSVSGITVAGDYIFQVTATDDEDEQTSKSITLRVAAAGVVPDVKWSEISAAILQPKCMSCHKPSNKKGGYDVTTYASTKTKVIVGAPADSLLYTEVQFDSMPATDAPLTEVQKKLIFDWIKGGAKQ